MILDAIEIELLGSSIARFESYEINTQKGKTFKSPIPPLARLLISEGLDPEIRVHIVRDWDGTGLKAVFKNDRKLSAWAEEDWIDKQIQVAHRIKYVPFVRGEWVSEVSEGK